MKSLGNPGPPADQSHRRLMEHAVIGRELDVSVVGLARRGHLKAHRKSFEKVLIRFAVIDKCMCKIKSFGVCVYLHPDDEAQPFGAVFINMCAGELKRAHEASLFLKLNLVHSAGVMPVNRRRIAVNLHGLRQDQPRNKILRDKSAARLDLRDKVRSASRDKYGEPAVVSDKTVSVSFKSDPLFRRILCTSCCRQHLNAVGKHISVGRMRAPFNRAVGPEGRNSRLQRSLCSVRVRAHIVRRRAYLALLPHASEGCISGLSREFM